MLHFLRQPFANRTQELPPQYLKALPLSFDTVDARVYLYSIVDLLVRAKYLMLQQRRTGLKGSKVGDVALRLQETESKALELGISNLATLLREAEVAIIISRREASEYNAAIASNDNIRREEVDKETVSMQQIRERMLAHGLNRSGLHALNLLLMNISELDASFRKELQYNVSDSREEHMRTYSRTLFFEEALFKGKIAAVISTVGLGLALLISRHVGNKGGPD